MTFNCGTILTHYNLFNEFHAFVLLTIRPQHAAWSIGSSRHNYRNT